MKRIKKTLVEEP